MADIRIALVGNPNTGKSTLFNLLTGLNQKIGNFPGITVDKKTGYFRLPDSRQAEVIDLPGTYSLYPKSNDERIVFEVLADRHNTHYPDMVVVVADATNLKRNLLLCTQVADLGHPVVLALNMTDLAKKEGILVDENLLAQRLGIRIVPISARSNEGIDALKSALSETAKQTAYQQVISPVNYAGKAIEEVKSVLKLENDYTALHFLHQHLQLQFLNADQKEQVKRIYGKHQLDSLKLQTKETEERYRYLNELLTEVVQTSGTEQKFKLTDRLDAILTHKYWGLLIFLLVLFFLFNAIFSWSAVPMDFIDGTFASLTDLGHEYLPEGVLTDLLLDGVLAGLGGIIIFIPQIAILFALISILEDTGYMARVTFMMDKMMRKVGLSGKSVVPMIGGIACAVPSIMSARNIESWKDRIITIMVTPLVSCSARLPVYTLLISLVVPEKMIYGFINLQGLTLMLMYLISIVAAVLVAWIMKFLIHAKERSYFIMELPVYRMPRWSNVFYTMYEKSKTFVFEAGKVIIAISIVLWVMASYGPGDRFEKIDEKYDLVEASITDEEELASVERDRSAEKLENSYAGILGHMIEPAIKPLGYDWKIGIALITSFAAREAFVGTISTIYSVESSDEETATIRNKMKEARDPHTGLPVFTFATALSLMLFYAFAMQCMSTVAIVYRETKSWKWPIIQLVYMTVMAYVAALLAYQFLK